MSRRGRLLILLLPIGIASAADSDGVHLFETKIRPVLATRCYACHSAKAAKPQGGLLLDSQAGVKRGGNSGPLADVILRALRYQDKDLRMPPGKPLPAEVVADFEAWVREGLPMPADTTGARPTTSPREFWSFQKPKLPAIPNVHYGAWANNDIDRFILAKLEAKGLAPSTQADRRTLIRRAYYDLTGLPPTAEEIEKFVSDPAPDAYPRLIDRLLASPRYGERWGRYWLDVARYSDARNVGERFAFSYSYRDWVIRAFNDDLPFDQFLMQQLAADRIAQNDRRNLAALGFLSLGREFPKSFPETVDDRIDTVARGMLGLTVACARCHDHKYDPIPTKDYYSFYSIFANVREPDDLPLLAPAARKTPKDAKYEQRLENIRQIDSEYRQKRCAEMVAFFKTQIAEYLIASRDSAEMSNTGLEELVRERQLNLHVLKRWRDYLAHSRASGEPVFQLWHAAATIPDAEFASKWPIHQTRANPLVTAAFSDPGVTSIREVAASYATLLMRYDSAAALPDRNQEELRRVLRAADAPVNVPVSEFELIYSEGDGNNTRGFRNRYNAMRAMYAYDGGAPRAMAVEDVPDPKPVHVFLRGNPNNPGVEAPPHFLSCLSSGEPSNFRDGSGRLELAQAIASKDNPLTARVMVNRVWLQHFGAGLVRTPSDFGLRGDPPTHPELLDYLAVRFMESGWSVKKLHRLIMLSSAYQQSSEDYPEARRVDPENQLVWRMNRRRLDIESLRDSMLAVAGRLDLALGGTPYALTTIPSVPRRTVYGYIERGRIPAMLSVFDFAIPDQHAPMRYTTTVPQQALFLLNSAFVSEQAKHLLQRAEVNPERDPAKSIERLYRAVFARNPTASELAAGLQYVSAIEPSLPASPPEPWQYGLGEYDPATERISAFSKFAYFTGDSWQGASMLPDAIAGKGRLRANGGEPGDTDKQAVIRRWISPIDGKISIEGSLRHNQTDVPTGDGVRARIVSPRLGLIASWVVNGSSAETRLGGIEVQTGDTIDFIVDGRVDTENDGFNWAPTISGPNKEQWSAAADFRGPAPEPLSVWASYAQVLLLTNEFAFVD